MLTGKTPPHARCLFGPAALLALGTAVACRQHGSAPMAPPPASAPMAPPPASAPMAPPHTAAAAAFPLRISADRRHLVDAQGKPFLIQGNAAWSLIVEVSEPDVLLYLDDRQARGFNTIVTMLTTPRFSSHTPPWANAAGDAPFSDPDDFATTDESYFAHADWVLRQAEARGIAVILAASYLGYECGAEGWCEHMKRNGVARLSTYGRWLGHRYRSFPNVIWLEAGDHTPSTEGTPSPMDLVNALAEGIKDGDGGNHLHTVEWSPETSGGEVPGIRWLDLDSTYSYSAPHLYQKTLADFQRNAGIRPFFNLEPLYENEHHVTQLQLRAQVYQSVLAGATGFMFGTFPVWNFWEPGKPRWQFDDGAYPRGWKTALDTPGTRSVDRAGQCLRALAWQELQPDVSHTVMVSGFGVFGSDRYSLLASTPDGRLAMAYFTDRLATTVDLSRMAGSVHASWFDPSSGEYTVVTGSPFPNAGTHVFVPAGANSEGSTDWLLLLQAR